MLAAVLFRLGVPKDYGENYEGLRLVFEVRLHNQGQGDIFIWDIDGEVFVGGDKSPRRVYLGRARSLTSLEIKQKTEAPTSVYLYLDLRPEDLEVIERLRDGGKPRFEIKLSILLTICLQNPPDSSWMFIGPCGQLQSRYLTRYTVVVKDLRGNSPIEVDRDMWLDVLSKLGFKYVRVIEVPAITGEVNEHAKAAIEYLDRAWVLMSANYEEALNAARKALEELKSYARDLGFIDEKGEIDFAKIYGVDTKSSLAEALDDIFRGLWALTNVGSHAGRSRLIKRADVEFVITTIYMLMKSMQENMKSQQP
jgi:hypothetical protein